MSKQTDEIARTYRQIKAPPHLATRIHAEVDRRPQRRHRWVPAGATVMAVVAAIWLSPESGQPPPAEAKPPKPSLAALASLKPKKPSGTTVSLTQIRSVKRPTLPVKPRLESKKPQTKLDRESDLFKEKDDVHS